jgi:hypothetical protein
VLKRREIKRESGYDGEIELVANYEATVNRD